MENCQISYNRKLKEREQDLIADQDVDDAQTAYKSAKADYENQLFYADRDYASVLTAKSPPTWVKTVSTSSSIRSSTSSTTPT